MQKYSVYIIQFPNNKKYVGITKNMDIRTYHHIWKSNNNRDLPVHKAMNKYSGSYVITEILSTLSLEDAKHYEVYFIEKLGSHISKNGYNCTLGGEGTTGLVKTKQSIDKWKKATKGIFSSPEYRKKLSETIKNSHSKLDTKIRLSNAQKNRLKDPKELKKLKDIANYLSKDSSHLKKLSKGQKSRFSRKEERELASIRTKKRFSDIKVREALAIKYGAKFFDVFQNGVFVKRYLIKAECERELSVQRTLINRCLSGKSKSAKNYTFKYVE